MKTSLYPVAPLLAASLFVTAARAEPQPDFTLLDVNPDSIRSGQMISPRDYSEQVSIFYFGREW